VHRVNRLPSSVSVLPFLSLPVATALSNTEIFVDICVMLTGMFLLPANVGNLTSAAQNIDAVSVGAARAYRLSQLVWSVGWLVPCST
jgi:hypothetical protein